MIARGGRGGGDGEHNDIVGEFRDLNKGMIAGRETRCWLLKKASLTRRADGGPKIKGAVLPSWLRRVCGMCNKIGQGPFSYEPLEEERRSRRGGACLLFAQATRTADTPFIEALVDHRKNRLGGDGRRVHGTFSPFFREKRRAM